MFSNAKIRKCEYCGKDVLLSQDDIYIRTCNKVWQEYFICPYCNEKNFIKTEEMPTPKEELKFISYTIAVCIILIAFMLFIGGR